MLNFSQSQFSTKSGAWLLLVNVALLLVNAVLIAQNSKSSLAVQESVAKASKVAEHLGMEVGYAKDPLWLLIDKDFPRTNNFELTDHSQRMVVIGEGSVDDAHAGATRSVAIALGPDFDLTCFFSVEKDILVRELQLTVDNKIYLDMNADGFFDQRVLLPEQNSTGDFSETSATIQLWHGGQWRDVNREVKGTKYRRILQDGGGVEFDMKKGCWLPPEDAADTSNESSSVQNSESIRTTASLYR